MAVIVEGNQIMLTGTVGGYFWLEDGFSAAEVFMALMQIGAKKNVVVHVNSGGGAASEGAAIHSILSAHAGAVDVVVEGWAASAASVLAMAGRTITMMPGSVLMIHEPENITVGDAADHQRTINELNATGDASAQIYALRTRKSAPAMRALMKAETWMTGPQAVAAGFADKIGDAPVDIEPVAYALESYSRVPVNITAIATARGWKPRSKQTAVPAVQPSHTEKLPETDLERANRLATEIEALEKT